MNSYGYTGNNSEANPVASDTVKYALQAGGQGFDSPHLHHVSPMTKKPSVWGGFFADQSMLKGETRNE